MKKLTFIKFAIAGFLGFLLLCSYREGPASYGGYECTGAETDNGNGAGCAIGGGCHSSSATTGITVNVELDSAGKATKYYKGGGSYTIKITGTNTTSNSLPGYGFQVGVIKGSVSTATPTNEGTFSTSLPTGVQYAAPGTYYMVGVVEHSQVLSPTTGTGGKGSTYVESFGWTAPKAGTGTISVWGVLNAVNNDSRADAQDLWNTNELVLTEITNTTGINEVADNDGLKVYPNPVNEHVTFLLANEVNNGTVSLYDMTGRMARQVNFSGKEITLERADLAKGIYIYTIANQDNSSVRTGKIVVE